MINLIIGILFIILMTIGLICMSYVLYTLIRDDHRREKERKKNPDKKYY